MEHDSNETMRLSKRMAQLGLCSRREADSYIEQGWVKVNGQTAVLGQKVTERDRIDLNRQAHEKQAERVTILLNKPVGYVSGHGTATEKGDIAETLATEAVFGFIPMSSQKSYLGHTLGACGALEAWFTIEMMNSGWFAPTVNLNDIDPRCGKVDYILSGGREIETDYVVSNNFAFGGVNTSLVFKRWRDEND